MSTFLQHFTLISVSGGDHGGSRGQDLPTFMAMWGPSVHGPPTFYRRATADNSLWPNLVLLLVVLCNYLIHQVVHGTAV